MFAKIELPYKLMVWVLVDFWLGIYCTRTTRSIAVPTLPSSRECHANWTMRHVPIVSRCRSSLLTKYANGAAHAGKWERFEAERF